MTPGSAAAWRSRVPGRSWPQPCGRLTTPRRTASVTSATAVTAPPAPLTRTDAVAHTEPFGVLRVDVQGAAVGAAREGRDVVHPGVVGAQVAAADQEQSGGALGHGPLQPGQVAGDRAGQQLHLAGAGPQRLRQARTQRPEVDAVRVGEQFLQRQPVLAGAEAVAVGAEAQHQVEPSLGAALAGELRGQFTRVAAVHRRVRAWTALPRVWSITIASTALGSAPCMPVAARIGREDPSRPSGRAPAGWRAGCSGPGCGWRGRCRRSRGAGLRGRGRRQHDVGVPGGLVEVGVDADHEVEGAERLVEAVAVGRGEHGVGGDGDERADRFAVLRRGVDLLGERGDGELALRLGVPAHAGVPAAEGEALAGASRAGRPVGGCLREEGAAGPVEVAGEDVEDVDEPAGEGAVAGRCSYRIRP
ncbi:hypothetical protein SGLAM104S_03885 [Streptomyces glaucescens]